MGKIANFARRLSESRSSISDPNHWIARITNQFSTKSGLQITPESALNTSTVFACVRVISETVASLPLLVYRKLADGGKEVFDNHPLYYILHDSPNPWQTKFEFFEMSTGHVCLRGNSYAFIVRDNGNRIKGFVPLNPGAVTIEVAGDFDAPKITYRYRPEMQGVYGAEQLFDSTEIWHVKGLSSDGITGISPLSMARESIGLAQASESHGAMFFRNGAQTSLVATTPGKLNEDSHKRLRESIQTAVSGDNKFKVLLLEQGLDAKAVGMSNADSQFLETRQFQVEEIARIFRVPSILIGHSNNNSTYASAEQFMLSFVTHTIRPWVSRIEQSINKYLLSDQDRKAGVFAEFKLDGLLRGDTQSRYTAYASALQNMWMNKNEVRSLENLNPVGPEGDKFENPATTSKETPGQEVAPVAPAKKDEEARTTVINLTLPEIRIEPAKIEVHPAEINLPENKISVEVKGKTVTSKQVVRDKDKNIIGVEVRGHDQLGIPFTDMRKVLRSSDGEILGIEGENGDS
jgi:HK97 family phage portal protein